MRLPSFLCLVFGLWSLAFVKDQRPKTKDQRPIFADYVKKFSRQKILIVGDVVADQFVYGAIARVSREAPVFILRHEQTQTMAGGAANAAVNVAALGGRAVLLGVVGADATGEILLEKLKSANVETEFLLKSAAWQTTTKVRILAGQAHAPRQQVIRLDYENETALPADLQNALVANLEKSAADAAAIIVSDYNYGAAGAGVAVAVREIAARQKIPLLVDSRFRLPEFAGATSATPNEDEVEHLLERKFKQTEDLTAACAELREKLDFEALLVTRGANGMLLIETGKPPLSLSAVGSLDPVDVTGAGDTVMAAYALSLASGASFAEAAEIANHAGGVVVMKRGTATVSAEELLKSLVSRSSSVVRGKSGERLTTDD